MLQKKTIPISWEEFIAKTKTLKKAATVFAANIVMITGDLIKNQNQMKVSIKDKTNKIQEKLLLQQ